MALRPPRLDGLRPHPVDGHAVLEHEIVAEKAATLGRLGRELRRRLDALAEGEAAGAEGEAREALLDAAGFAAWSFFVQRELCGLRDRAAVVAEYAIPGAVLARMGGMRR